MKRIDEKIRAYYKGKSLTEDQIKRIVDGKQKANQKKSKRRFLKYAAGFLLLITSFFVYQNLFTSKERLLQKYGKEVAYNHSKKAESKIHSSNVKDLNEKMDKLDFEIHMPESVLKKYVLLGGKYCSVDKRLAAQLKLEEKGNKSIATLYVLKQLKNEDFNDQILIDSTNIQIWNEQSNLFVLASDVN